MRRRGTPRASRALGTCAAVLIACAAASPALRAPDDPPAAGALRARLLFDDGVDLDLYVTGPDLETVYFANSPSRVGGALERDLRCDAGSGTRVETVVFPAAPPGRYRVGVDYPERCGGSDPAPFLVVVEADGVREEKRGVIRFGRFDPVVLELELPSGR